MSIHDLIESLTMVGGRRGLPLTMEETEVF